jgi:hypothetical protein
VTEPNTGPPIEDGAPEGPTGFRGSATTPTNTKNTATNHRQRFDALAGLRQRREHAVRVEGGDPEYPGDLQYHQPSTGLRASGFRQGFACGGTDALRRVWRYIPDEYRGLVSRIATDYEGGHG